MTHISRKNIGSIDYLQAEEKLILIISKLKASGAEYLISELFTDAERIMIIKRFAAILMLQQEYSTYRIGQAIGISTSTSRLIYDNYINGNYDKLLSSINKKQKSEFLSVVEDFMLSKISIKARHRLLKRVL